MKQILLLFALMVNASLLSAQLNIAAGTRVNIAANTYMVVTGDFITKNSIAGTGTIMMKGTAIQKVNLSGLTVPRLTINNPAHVQLAGNGRINNSLGFLAGKLIAGNYYLLLNSSAITTGAGAGKFFETNGTGLLRKQVTANLSNFLLPVGNGSNYTPVSVTTSGTYSSAILSARARGTIHPNKPASSTSYLNTYWTITRQGITGTVTAAATYLAANVVGTESALKGTFFNGTSFNGANSTINTTSNIVTSSIPSNGDVYAMSIASSLLTQHSNSVKENDRKVVAGIYPNPVKTFTMVNIFMESAEPVMIRIFDVNGKTILQEYTTFSKGMNQYRVDMNKLNNGAYQLQLKSATLDRTFQVIKEN